MIGWVFGFLVDHTTVAALVLSGLALLSSRQDADRRRMFGAIFWQGLALFVLVLNLMLALVYHWWVSVPVITVALSVEIWFAKRWWSSTRPIA